MDKITVGKYTTPNKEKWTVMIDELKLDLEKVDNELELIQDKKRDLLFSSEAILTNEKREGVATQYQELEREQVHLFFTRKGLRDILSTLQRLVEAQK